MKQRPSRTLVLAAALGLATAAQADSGNLAMPRDMPAAYTQECASCHTAYAPAVLPARSWQRIMSSLDRHYGTDASLDAATLRQIDRVPVRSIHIRCPAMARATGAALSTPISSGRGNP